MWERGIAGWQPEWRSGAEQVNRHADALVSLVGAKLTGAWSIWIDESDWYADMPVVLQFDGSRQLEICWQKFDDLSISWNTINIDLTPRGSFDHLSWRPWAHLALRKNRGQTVSSVAATESVFTRSDVDHPHREHSTTFTGGLWLATTGPGLHIFNALDENGLATTYEPDLLKPLP